MQEPATDLRFRTVGPDQTQLLAAALATVLADGDLLVLTGDLGAGKTCFTQGLGRGLGIDQRITSPTFTLANRYQGRLTLNHLDVYRLESSSETLDLGLDELVEDGVTVIEWGDKIQDVLPQGHLVIALRYPEPFESGSESESQADDFDDPTLAEREIEIRVVGSSSEGRWSDRDLATVLAPWASAS